MNRYLRLVSLPLLAVAGCAPYQAYKGPAADFAAANSQLSSAISTDVSTAATTKRISHLRIVVSIIITRPQPGTPLPLLSDGELLCDGVIQAERALFNQGYLAALGENLTRLTEPPPEKFEDLAKLLIQRYQIRIKDSFSDKDIRTACEQVFNNPDKWVAMYPLPGGSESLLELKTAGEALYAFVSTVGQIVLQQVDEARKARALAQFFSDEKNIEGFRQHIDEIRKLVVRRLAIERAIVHKKYALEYAALAQKLSQLSIVNEAGCQKWIAIRQKTPIGPSLALVPEFRGCFDAAWNALAPNVEKTLAAAADYDDIVMAKEISAFDALQKAVDKMVLLANGKIDSSSELVIFVDALIRIGTVADTLKNKLTSEDSKKTYQLVKDLVAKYGR